MKKLILFGFVFVLLASFVSALPARTAYYTFDSNMSDSVGTYQPVGTEGSPTIVSHSRIGNGSLHLTNDVVRYGWWNNVVSAVFWSNLTAFTSAETNHYITGQTSDYGGTSTRANAQSVGIYYLSPYPTDYGVYLNNAGNPSYINGSPHVLNTWKCIGIIYNGTHVIAYENGTRITSELSHSGGSTDYADWTYAVIGRGDLVGREIDDVYIDDLQLWNVSLTDSDMMEACGFSLYRPVLSNYNLTSGWSGASYDNVAPYKTNDTTPTFTLDTDENSDCRIGINDLNYTDMGSTRDCSGGEGTMSHTCTVISADNLSYSLSNQSVYISCVNIHVPTNQTTSSSSGSLDTIIWPEYELSGTVKDSASNAIDGAIVMVMANNTGDTIRYNTTSNATGDWDTLVFIDDIYTVCAYDPNNSTLRGDCTPFISVT